MNKFFTPLCALILLASCSKSENPADNGDNIILDNLSSISVADAKLIYKRTGISRASSASDDVGYWKIDLLGNESKIVIYDKNGNVVNLEIDKIEKLNDDLLLIEPTSLDPLIADLRSEKLYTAPEILRTPVKEAPDGLLYFIGASTNGVLYKFDPQNFTIEQALPDGQKCNDFLVNKEGVIYYDNKFKLPSGTIIPNIVQPVFLLNGDFFSLDTEQQFEISKWHLTSDNNLLKTNILSLLDVAQFEYGLQPARFVQIRQNKSALIYLPTYLENVPGHEGVILFEFDGSNAVMINSYGQDQEQCNRLISIWLDMTETHPVESIADNYLCFLPGQILAFNIEDFSISLTPCAFPEGYEVYESSVDQINRRLLFTALRYEDGKVVIGEVSDTGQISIINEKASENRIINLIPLN